ncbi:MAG: Alpha/Beta hydrolase protein [Linnemannia gamsii]|nr:MAG: Alpha/Beta hydrolase protein [Linnemannia gamsii]
MATCRSLSEMPDIFSKCLALNKNTESTDRISCSTQLPTICSNSVMRRVLLFGDNSRQVKMNTSVGQIQGWHDPNAFRFLGIPYAEAPVGDLRFAAPVPKAPFTSTYDATVFGHICPQTPKSRGVAAQVLAWLETTATEDEDCLNLNVYTPSLRGDGQESLPVMLYLHGGGFSDSLVIFEPGNLVSRGGVVVVTINYRLGMLGWFENVNSWVRSSIPGNQAFRDQILALQWVQKNIASFGGDPNRVTVFGQSASATNICALLSAPSTFGLYQRVISESDTIDIPFKTPQDAAKINDYHLTLWAATVKADQLALNDDIWTTFGLVERPVIDGELIMDDFSVLVKEGRYNTNASIIWGTVKDEAGFYVLIYYREPVPIARAALKLELVFDKNRTAVILASDLFPLPANDSDAFRVSFTQFGTDYYWLCPLQYFSRQMTMYKPIYVYRFSRGRDMPLTVFGSGAAVPGFSQTGCDACYARQVIDRFTTFVKTGNPNPQHGPFSGVANDNSDVTEVEWLPYNDSDVMLDMNAKSELVHNLRAASCQWIEQGLKSDFMFRVPKHV